MVLISIQPQADKSTFTQTKEPPPTHTPTNTSTPTPDNTNTFTPTETIIVTETATPEPPSPTSPPATVTSSAEPNKKTVDDKSDDNPSIKVSITTNCRTGPGVSYPKLSALFAGKTVPLIGRDKYYTYYIIKDPGRTGRDCWLWGYYATTTGNTKNLKIYTAPGQPTKRASTTPVSTVKKTTPPATKT